jgi:transposase
MRAPRTRVFRRVTRRLREFYRTPELAKARAMLEELIEHCRRRTMPAELQKLGRTLHAWFDKICNYHLARISNGPTEALNNLIKRIKRIGFGFRNFDNYRIRRTALRRQTQLARPRLHRRPVTAHPVRIR